METNQNDFLTKARTYFAQMLIEDNMFDFYETIKDGKTAAFYFKKMNRPDSYAHCLMYLANIYATALMNDSVIKYISLCKSMLPNLSSNMRNEFYGTYISSVSDSCGKDSLNRLIQEYLEAVPESDLDTLSLANLYNQATEPDKALSLLLPFKGSKNNRSRYYSIIHSSYAQKGMYKEAYETHSKYMALRDTIEQTQNALGTRFVKPKQLLEQQIKATEQSRAQVILTAAGCILALSGWLFVVYQQLKTWRRRKKEAEEEIEKQRQQKAAAEQEAREYAARHSRMCEEMQTLRQNLEESQALNRTAKVLMAHRLALLNELIADKSGKHSPVQDALTDMLSKPETFIQSARQTLSVTHPRFIRTLQQHNLSDEEIGLCCLYALGLNTKQAGIYAKPHGPITPTAPSGKNSNWTHTSPTSTFTSPGCSSKRKKKPRRKEARYDRFDILPQSYPK